MPVPQFVTSGVSIVEASLFAICFLWLGLALGRRALTVLGVSDGTVAERGLVGLALGLGLLQWIVFALSAAHAMSVQSLRLATLLLAVALIGDLRAVATRFLSVLRANRAPTEGWLTIWALTLAPGIVGAFLLAVTPTIDADGLGYHLTVVKRWLTIGSLAFLPTYTYSNMPMGVELLFAFAMSFAGDTAAKLLHFSLGSAGAIAVYLAGRRLHSAIAGAAAATLYLFGPFGVAIVLGWAYVEGALAFAVVASVLAWLVWFETRRPSWLRIAFAVAGIAVSFKITAALFPLGLLLLTWFTQSRDSAIQQKRFGPLVIHSWPLVLLVAIPVAPWLLRAAIVTGNPVFPMLGTIIPSRDFPPALSAEWDLYFRYLNWGTGAGREWTLETRKSILGVAMLAIALCSGAGAILLRPAIVRATAIVAGVLMILQVLAVGLYKRHWVAVMSVIQLLVLAQASRMVPRRWQRGTVIGLSLTLSLMSVRTSMGSVQNDVGGVLRTAVGLEPQRDFLVHHLPLYPLYEYANGSLPRDAGVAMVYGCGGFHIDRKTFCLEIPQGALSVESVEAFVTDGRQLGLTHIIAPRLMARGSLPVFPNLVRTGVGYTFKERTDAVIVRLLTRHGTLLASAADQGLYGIDLNAAE